MVKLAVDPRKVVASVVDPEIPVLTIEDLGILRSVEEAGGSVVVTITPTYSGCPAMRQIEDDIASALRRAGIEEIEIRVTHNPAWTNDWISEVGHR
jgi:ring-1,2-phenylacetyl-CoA epoxidase subunit PaaD